MLPSDKKWNIRNVMDKYYKVSYPTLRIVTSRTWCH